MSAIAPAPGARWWHALENKKVVCRLCPRECHIPAGSRGFCFVRANVDGRLELTTYGRSSGFCIDPVEKKPLNHFLPGTPILSFGTAGCNLGCKFCQNWDISKSREVDKLAHFATPEAIAEAAIRSGCRSLAFTYNDPVIWAEYAIDIAKAARARGLKTVAVTAGYISAEARGEFYEHMDAANVDLKAFTDGFYSKLCQVNLDPILETLKFLKRETNVWFELTNLMIPGENDSTDETKAMCGWIMENLGADVPVHFTAFHPDFKMRETPRTPPETLVRAREIAMAAGIRYAYVGNVNDVANQSTYCHGCGKLLIERDWHELGKYHLRGNACTFCGTVIPGVFDDAGPGKWGRRRMPIQIGNESVIRITTPMTRTQTVPAARAAVAPAMAPKIDMTAEEDAELLNFTRAIVASSLRGELFSSARLSASLDQAPSFGLFVSLFRGTQLRSCKGQWGGTSIGTLSPLGQLLPRVARDAALDDPRFPRVTLGELPFLQVEISLMHSPEGVTARGAERARSVHVGTHGLVIRHPAGAGLLLPHVASEAGWDSKTFLEHLCLKAGLPPQTWLEDQAQLMTFRARKITAPASIAEIDLQAIGSAGLTQLMQYIHQVLAGNGAAAAPGQNQAPLLQHVHAEELGLCLQTPSGISGATISANVSLLQLAKTAAQSLAGNLRQQGRVEPVHRMTVLWQPMLLAAADYPARHRTLAGATILAQANGRWSIAIPSPKAPTDAIAGSLANLQITPQQWLADRAGQIQLRAFNALHCHNPAAAAGQAGVPQAVGAGVRPAFRAGAFYPADAAQCVAEVDGFLRGGGLGQVAAQSARAIMLPHAGWRFCGGTLGKTLAGVKLPRTMVIVGPKHTALGPPCSVASYTGWQIPGATVGVSMPLVRRLAAAVPWLQCEEEAHRQEHGVEVLLPFLHRLRPDLQIVPIALGPLTYDATAALALALAALLRDSPAEERPLLVISSDMNHFAPDAETRRRDGLALEAMKTSDPRRLFDACVQNDISMCGLLPAVTVMQALRAGAPDIRPRVIDYSTSAAASGDTGRVVGYAGVVIP